MFNTWRRCFLSLKNYARCKIERRTKSFFRLGYYRNYGHKHKSAQRWCHSKCAGFTDIFCVLLIDTYSITNLMISFTTINIDIKYNNLTAPINTMETLFDHLHENLLMRYLSVMQSLAQWLMSEYYQANHRYYLPSTRRECIFINMFILHLSFYAVAAKSPFTPAFISPWLRLSFLQNVIRHYFSI
jgi:hypothetical protein